MIGEPRRRYIPAMSDTPSSIPSILIVPDQRLRAKSRKITPADHDRVASLIPDMFKAMYKAPGIGLAAPQIGEMLRLIVLDLGPDGEPAPMVMINPDITATSEEVATREEGCLSLPGQYADVTRPARVTARYQDAEGARHEIEADGLLAACIQHEIDHLDGVLFVDHLSALKRNMLLRKLAKEQREKSPQGKGR